MTEFSTNRNVTLLLFGATVGLVYGLLLRAIPQYYHSGWLAIMSLGMLFLLPFAMGFVSVFVVERRHPQPVWVWIVLPLITLLGSLLAMMLAVWEGLICIVMFAPIGMVLTMLGGVAGGWAARRSSRRASNVTLACVMVLPLLTGTSGNPLFARRDLERVDTAIDIHAPAQAVWKNIERVPKIQPEELPGSWSHRIGFPDPVEATLSAEGVGGVRHATFAGGVLFIETIDVWEPEQRLAFSIEAQTRQIPKTTLDDHVTIGGPFFDVLRGEYRLEPLPDGTIRLHLSSQHRLSTQYNWYARLWTEAIMADLQNRILQVVRQRSEQASGAR